MHGAGSLQAQRIQIAQQSRLTIKKDMTKTLVGVLGMWEVR